mmetsp:Transcript_112261/g.290019  ORF Transcript_112261/g.290019 Transcript_112261/m.290019 type:complete len:339 (-) Transcript_112261:13-1029(-)
MSSSLESSNRLWASKALSTNSKLKPPSGADLRWFAKTRKKRVRSRDSEPNSRARCGSTMARSSPRPSSKTPLRLTSMGPTSCPGRPWSATERRSRFRRAVEAKTSPLVMEMERMVPSSTTSMTLYVKPAGLDTKRLTSAGSADTNSLEGSSVNRGASASSLRCSSCGDAGGGTANGLVSATSASMSSMLQPFSSQPNCARSPSCAFGPADAELGSVFPPCLRAVLPHGPTTAAAPARKPMLLPPPLPTSGGGPRRHINPGGPASSCASPLAGGRLPTALRGGAARPQLPLSMLPPMQLPQRAATAAAAAARRPGRLLRAAAACASTPATLLLLLLLPP